jgi:tungstate transport system permease protein
VDFLADGVQDAFQLLVHGDGEVYHAIFVSLLCSVTAVGLAALVGIPYGTWLGLERRTLGSVQVLALRLGMFVPTVVLGLLVYAFLSRRGLFGSMDLLYTKQAIVIGEFLLAFPILGTFAHAAAQERGPRIAETARTLGARPWQVLRAVISENRLVLIGAGLAAFARCLTELGISINAGGTFRMKTETLPTKITTELSGGDFARAVACGVVLMLVAMVPGFVAFGMTRRRRS